MPRDSSLVQRLIAFLKRPDASPLHASVPVKNPYDDFAATQPRPPEGLRSVRVAVEAPPAPPPPRVTVAAAPATHSAHQASRLDALVMRIVIQFSAQMAYVISRDADGTLRYSTGRDLQGRYVPFDQAHPDHHAVRYTLDTGQSQLFPQTAQHTPALCGPLWHEDQLVGLLYLDTPARSRLHRGVFDVLCAQLARMIVEGHT